MASQVELCKKGETRTLKIRVKLPCGEYPLTHSLANTGSRTGGQKGRRKKGSAAVTRSFKAEKSTHETQGNRDEKVNGEGKKEVLERTIVV